MNNKKLTDILFVVGICIIIIGILVGVIAGFVFSEESFNFVPAITLWLLCIIVGTGAVSVANDLSDAKKQKKNDEEVLKSIIEKIKNEKTNK